MDKKQEKKQEPEVFLPVREQVSVGEMIETSRLKTEVELAQKYPRSLSKAIDEMMFFATMDEETASSCFFCLPRAGKQIKGASIRLAEIAVRCFGNLKVGSRIVDVVAFGDNPHVVCQGVAIDLENISETSMEKTRPIYKKKNASHPDSDDISLAVNACSAIAFRDAAFKIIPRPVIEKVRQAAMKVAIGEAHSFGERRDIVVEKLIKMGVPEPVILRTVACRSRIDIDVEGLATLIGCGTAIKEGEPIEEVFDIGKRAGTPTGSGLDSLPTSPVKPQGETPTPPPTGSGETKPQVKPVAKSDTIKIEPNEMTRSELLEEIKEHQETGYYYDVLTAILPDPELVDEVHGAPDDMLEEILTALREKAHVA